MSPLCGIDARRLVDRERFTQLGPAPPAPELAGCRHRRRRGPHARQEAADERTPRRVRELCSRPSEVATLFRVDPKTVTRWAKAGKLSSIRTLGGHRRYRESEVRDLLNGDPAAAPVGRLSDRTRPAEPVDRDRRAHGRRAPGTRSWLAPDCCTSSAHDLRGSRRRDPRSLVPESRVRPDVSPCGARRPSARAGPPLPPRRPPSTVSAFLRASGAAVAARRVAPQLTTDVDRPAGLRPRVEARHELVDGRRQLGARHRDARPRSRPSAGVLNGLRRAWRAVWSVSSLMS